MLALRLHLFFHYPTAFLVKPFQVHSLLRRKKRASLTWIVHVDLVMEATEAIINTFFYPEHTIRLERGQ